MKVDLVKIKMVRESVIEYDIGVDSPDAAATIIRQMIGDSDRENLVLVCLDTKNKPTSVQLISTGSINSSIVHPREVFKSVLLANAASFIIGHNHPSGELSPSPEDINITKRLIEVGKLIGIPIIDHLIVSDSSYVSMRTKGRFVNFE